ncbi:MAG: hypothetical protein ACR2N2_06070 [Acidimicrobiia bacterium]
MMPVLFHTDDPIVIPADGTGPTSSLEGFSIGDYVGNPMYDIVGEHTLAALLLVVSPFLIWGLIRVVSSRANSGVGWAVSVRDRYAAAPLATRLSSILIGVSSVVHVLLAFTHEVSSYTPLYLAGGAVLGWASWQVLAAKRRLAIVAIVGSVVAFWFLGLPPDQLGLATKLIEILALILLAVPVANASRKRRLAPVGVVSLLVATGIAAWVGAFVTVGEDGGHHGGAFPDPGTLVPYIERLEPTPEESHYADDLYWATYAAIEKYRDPAVAAAAGYDVGNIAGNDHHAQNPALVGDGRILDAEYPESLIYAETAEGPQLIGVMFEMDGFTDRGPTDGGPIMLWHGHENVCFSVIPFALAGLESPFGGCPIASFNVPQTGEMLHAWMMPDVPEDDRWGHVDEEWLEAYLNQFSG